VLGSKRRQSSAAKRAGDLSIIATPPVERHPIKTFVTHWNDALIQEACQREINRGGADSAPMARRADADNPQRTVPRPFLAVG
jgi:hypothetical protein